MWDAICVALHLSTSEWIFADRSAMQQLILLYRFLRKHAAKCLVYRRGEWCILHKTGKTEELTEDFSFFILHIGGIYNWQKLSRKKMNATANSRFKTPMVCMLTCTVLLRECLCTKDDNRHQVDSWVDSGHPSKWFCKTSTPFAVLKPFIWLPYHVKLFS